MENIGVSIVTHIYEEDACKGLAQTIRQATSKCQGIIPETS